MKVIKFFFFFTTINSFCIQPKNIKLRYKISLKEIKYKIDVPLEQNRYPIYIGKNIIKEDRQVLKPILKDSKILIVTNNIVAALHLNTLVNSLTNDYNIDVLILKDGERQKNISQIMKIIKKCLSFGLDRTSTIIGLGGGVIGDMTGFSASIYMRGISFIQIPTTIMAMVDSSIGGKTGINDVLGKNLIGTFYQPSSVIIDIEYLKTLPNREFNSGLSEVIKYGLIYENCFLDWIELNVKNIKNKDYEAICYMINMSCKIKSEIISIDEKEKNYRAILNLGHTFGHSIENCLGYGTLLHGEAISIGILMSADVSLQLNLIDKNYYNRIKKLLLDFELPIQVDYNVTVNNIINTMMLDKKNKNNQLYLILINSKKKKKGVNLINIDDNYLLKNIIKKYL